MLTLMPLNPIQSALKRRNSKSYDFSRRGSLSVYSTYSLPNSKDSMRRFSSYEELAPIFQLFSSSNQHGVGAPPQETAAPTKLSPTKPQRRGSIAGIIRRESRSRKTSNDPCAQLDAQLARIKRKLSQFKNEDLELSHRVDDLSTSVQKMYDGQVARPMQHRMARLRNEKKDRPYSAADFVREPSPSSLQVIAESHLESSSDSEEEQSYEDYCRKNVPKLGVTSRPQRTSISFSVEDADTNTKTLSINFLALDVSSSHEPQEQKKHYLPNNIVQRPKSKSAPVLSMVKNDLTKPDFDHSKRLSLISSLSDSAILSHDYRPSPLCFEKTAEAL